MGQAMACLEGELKALKAARAAKDNEKQAAEKELKTLMEQGRQLSERSAPLPQEHFVFERTRKKRDFFEARCISLGRFASFLLDWGKESCLLGTPLCTGALSPGACPRA